MNKDDENYVYYLVGQNIKRIRIEKGLKQSDLAQRSTYSLGFIMNIESKKYLQTFALGTLWTIAKALDVDMAEFFRPLD